MIFRWGEFTSNAGLRLPFKLELDALADADWDCLARMVAEEFLFHSVEGVPTGGERFAAALRPFVSAPPAGPALTPIELIVDDVLTTGGSMERQRAGRNAVGIVVFDRSGGKCPGWIVPIFTLGRSWV